MSLATFGCGGDDPPDAGETDGEDETGEEPEEEGPDPAAACMGTADALVYLGSAEHQGAMDGLQHLAAMDDMLYGCAENSGLAVWDVGNLAAPRLVRADPSGIDVGCHGLAINETTGRLAVAREDSIELYSLEDPANPTLVTSHPQAGVVDLAMGDDGRLFAAAEAQGVFAYGLDGDAITELARASDGQSDSRAVAVSGNMLAVAEGRNGARVYQTAGNSLAPSSVVPLTGTSVEIEMNGFTAYVATLDGIAQLDAADPAAPRFSGYMQTPGTAMGLAVTDTAVWLSDWTALRAFDLATLSNAADEPLVSSIPSLLNRTPTVLEHDGAVFVAHWDGMRTYAPCTPNAPSLWPEMGRMEFNNVTLGQPTARVLTLRNLGNQPLVISALTTDNPDFTTEPGPLEIAPGAAAPIELTYTPSSDLPIYANLIINSNDPDEPTRMVSMAGNIPRAPVGSKVEGFHDVDTNGRAWRPQDLEGSVTLLSYFAFW